jgi:hypothetical protein
MSAPPGFNPNASLLPDPGASSAPIHVMRGGGQKGGAWTEAQLKVLTEYGLAPGQPLAEKVNDEVKTAFLEQLPLCDGIDASIVDKKCWAVQQVVKAILNTNVASAVAGNALSLDENVSNAEVLAEFKAEEAKWRGERPEEAAAANKSAAENAALELEAALGDEEDTLTTQEKYDNLKAAIDSAVEKIKQVKNSGSNVDSRTKKAFVNARLRLRILNEELEKAAVTAPAAGTGNANVNSTIAEINTLVAAEKAKKPAPISIPAAATLEADEPPSPNVPTPTVETNTLENSEHFLQGVSTNYLTATSETTTPPEVNTLADEAISADLAKQTQVENNPKNFRGNRSGKSAKFRTDLTRKAGQRYYADFMVDGKPVRIRGNSPDSILRRYNYESQERPKAFQRTLRAYGEQQESKKKQQYYVNLAKAKQNAAERQKKESEQSLKNIAAREAKEEQKHLENVVKQQQEEIKRQQNEQKLALAESEAKLKAAKNAAKKAASAAKPSLGNRFKKFLGKSRRNRTLYRKTRKNRK